MNTNKKPNECYTKKRLAACFSAAFMLLAPSAYSGQILHDPIVTETTYYSWSSGTYTGLDSEEPIETHIVSARGAVSMQLRFANVQLGSASYITITSLEDGNSQLLNSENIGENYSAMFNGDRVEVAIYAKAPDQNVSIDIDRIEVRNPVFSTESICGTVDNRFAFNDPAVARLNNGCTAWIIPNGKIVSAGHCTDNVTNRSFIEFNVPQSNASGQLRNAAPQHQYLLDVNSLSYVDGGRGNDWAVFNVLQNSQTGLSPIQAQGKSFNVVQGRPSDTIRITGFGVDDGATNQTLQTHTGALANVTNESVFYTADTRGGNSGSPIIDNATGNAVGVHTHGGCTVSGGSNSGTRATLGAFWNALGLNDTPTGSDITNFNGSISSQYRDWPAGEDNGNLVDNNANSKYLTFNSSAWVQFEASSPSIVTGYSLTSANDAPQRDPASWTLQGSNNGAIWSTLDGRSSQDFPNRFQKRSFTFNNTASFRFYRFNLQNNSGNLLQLAEFELFGRSVNQGFSQKVEAESYTNMFGVQLEGTADNDGGQNVGYIDAGDWMAFERVVNIPQAGAYRIKYRVASPNGALLSTDLNAGAIQLGAVTIPSTGGWQNWTTVEHNVNLPAGPLNLGIFAQQTGWNINWFLVESL